MSKLNLVLAISLGGTSLVVPSLAQAHFMLVAPSSWWTQLADGTPQKLAPCGDEVTAGTAATRTVNVYQPGQPVTVTVDATIAHPGWWRISLREGSASTQVASTFPDPTPLGAAGSAQQCTPAFINNPVWSTTQPVLLDKLGLPAGSTSTTTVQSGTQSFQVTIPTSARCTSASPCTLQVLMFMTDHPAGSCNYHHCADMAAAASDGGAAGTGGATGAGGATATSTGGHSGAGGAATGGATGGTGTGGRSGTGTGGSMGSGGADTGGATGSSGTGGATVSTGSGGRSETGAGTGGATATGSDASGASSGGTNSSGGCSCSVGHTAGSSTFASMLILAAWLVRRRRR